MVNVHHVNFTDTEVNKISTWFYHCTRQVEWQHNEPRLLVFSNKYYDSKKPSCFSLTLWKSEIALSW